jgi:hypothetical protein
MVQGLPNDELQQICQHLIYKRYHRGETFYLQKTPADRMFFIEHGEARLIDPARPLGKSPVLHDNDSFCRPVSFRLSGSTLQFYRYAPAGFQLCSRVADVEFADAVYRLGRRPRQPLFVNASPNVFALVQGIAAGAMLTMIAETMLPEAYFKGGLVVAMSTLMGFLVAIFFNTLEVA